MHRRDESDIARDFSSRHGSDERELIRVADSVARELSEALGWTSRPTLSFPGYESVREVFRGGQGIVYRAVQGATGREVAIKVLRDGPFRGPRDRVRFEREVRVLGRLQHPNIVTIHDGGLIDDCDYFVMDYISAQPLDAYVATHEPSVAEVLQLFLKICAAVHAAHVRGV